MCSTHVETFIQDIPVNLSDHKNHWLLSYTSLPSPTRPSSHKNHLEWRGVYFRRGQPKLEWEGSGSSSRSTALSRSGRAGLQRFPSFKSHIAETVFLADKVWKTETNLLFSTQRLIMGWRFSFRPGQRRILSLFLSWKQT